MNVLGVLIHAVPSRLAQVVRCLSQLEGVEVHQSADGGRIVATVEDTNGRQAIDTLRDIHALDGIVTASLVYHHFEPGAVGAAATV